MVMNDTLASALSKIGNAEHIGRTGCSIKPISKTIKKVLDLMNKNQYVGTYKEIEDGHGNYLEVNLIGKINKCGAIKPIVPITKDDFEKFEKRYLPAKGFGILIVSTVNGIVTHEDAKKKNVGGKLLAYIY